MSLSVKVSNQRLQTTVYAIECQNGNVWRTQDLGRSWVNTGGGAPTNFFTRNYQRLVALDANTLLFLDYNQSAVFRSANGGASWTQVLSLAACRDMSFHDALTGYAVSSDPVIKKTTDGGLTWSTVSAPGGTAALRVVTCQPGGSRAYAAALGPGNTAQIISTAGGAWSAQTAPAGTAFPNGIAVSSDGTKAVVVGGNGTYAAYTTDSGTNWSASTVSGGSIGPQPDARWMGGLGVYAHAFASGDGGATLRSVSGPGGPLAGGYNGYLFSIDTNGFWFGRNPTTWQALAVPFQPYQAIIASSATYLSTGPTLTLEAS